MGHWMDVERPWDEWEVQVVDAQKKSSEPVDIAPWTWTASPREAAQRCDDWNMKIWGNMMDDLLNH